MLVVDIQGNRSRASRSSLVAIIHALRCQFSLSPEISLMKEATCLLFRFSPFCAFVTIGSPLGSSLTPRD